jgi:hypothetical protein
MSVLDITNFAENVPSQDNTEQTGMQLWNEKQYGAWVMIGTTAIIQALYWTQYYYYHFWYGSKSKYAATDGLQKNLYLMNCYTMWGLAENINAITLLVQWIPTALVWILTATNIDGIVWFFVVWAGIMHYVDAIRFVIVNVIKIVGIWYDQPTMTNSFSGLKQEYRVSKEHSLSYWDFAMEWMAFMVSFGMYLDLHTIIEDMETRENAAYAAANPANRKDGDLKF